MEDEKVLRVNVRNSDLKIPKDRRQFLSYPSRGLVNCTIQDEEEGVVYILDTSGFSFGEKILKESEEDRLRFLVNCADLYQLSLEYEFSLDFDNLVYDYNLIPSVLIRDARTPDDTEFRTKYLALIGSVLKNKYKYKNYLEGGTDLYSKDPFLSKLSKYQDIFDIKNELLSDYNKKRVYRIQKTKLISKRNALSIKIAIPCLSLALAFFIAVSAWSYLGIIPNNRELINANAAYAYENFPEVIHVLKDIDISTLDADSKFILSRSYIYMESLKDNAKSRVLANITRNTDPLVFDYWINLGRLQFDDAVDISKRLQSDEMLFFSYTKQRAYTEIDTDISGEEKAKLLGDLDEKIKSLEEKLQLMQES